jgi:antitoxin (DNA-binding transcriptional repressor) of toxin-antitoxin stability system
MQQIDISEAKIHLPALLEAAIHGAEIIITENDQPLVRIAHIGAQEPARAQEQASVPEGANGYPKPYANQPVVSLTESELEAMSVAGGFLNDHLPDRFCAGRPQYDQHNHVWRVPILLSYPTLGPLGQAGEITVSSNADQILAFTPVEEMKAAAWAMIEQLSDQRPLRATRAGCDRDERRLRHRL